ncbi:hypothetical protein QQP08_012177 [Theobroma cacao]|nr:hypothetical protein QQP08_012177 [Theobroma cacao]
MNLQATTTNIAVQVNKLKCETQQLNKEELMQQQSSTEPTMKQLQFGDQAVYSGQLSSLQEYYPNQVAGGAANDSSAVSSIVYTIEASFFLILNHAGLGDCAELQCSNCR